MKLIREHFGLHHVNYKNMSPVIIPKGYTKSFIDGKVDKKAQMGKILDSFNETAAASDVMLIEGTGHVGVGACVQASNAIVANAVKADMILVANGGIGSAFDELSINYEMCRAHNVRLAGVVLNKVNPEKLEEVKKYMGALLKDQWNVPLLGVVPDKTFLGCPALADLERLFNTTMISGEEHRMRHYNVSQINLITTSLGRFLENLRNKPSRTLFVTHVTRNDIILAFMAEHHRSSAMGQPTESALIICGRDKYELFPEIEDMIKSSQAPIMHVKMSTWPVMSKIADFTPKLNIDDTHRVDEAVAWYEKHINFDELLRRTSSRDSSFDDPDSLPMRQ